MKDKDKKKYEPKRNEPDDNVGTIYCGENTEEYNSLIEESNDMFPYVSPLPKLRPDPEPPII